MIPVVQIRGEGMRRYLIGALVLGGLWGCEAQVDGERASSIPAEANLPGTGADQDRTVVYRDTFGVPHIYAPTVEDGLYAQGWAQAEDRPEQLLMNLKIAMGEFTEIAGDDGVQVSLLSNMFGHMRNAAVAVADMSDLERRRIRAFANGITDFYAAHPEDVPAWWTHGVVTPEMIDAFGRMFLYNWSIDEALGDLARGGVEADFVVSQRGSNQWAVAPQSVLGDAHSCRRPGRQRRGTCRFAVHRSWPQWQHCLGHDDGRT